MSSFDYTQDDSERIEWVIGFFVQRQLTPIRMGRIIQNWIFFAREARYQCLNKGFLAARAVGMRKNILSFYHTFIFLYNFLRPL